MNSLIGSAVGQFGMGLAGLWDYDQKYQEAREQNLESEERQRQMLGVPSGAGGEGLWQRVMGGLTEGGNQRQEFLRNMYGGIMPQVGGLQGALQSGYGDLQGSVGQGYGNLGANYQGALQGLTGQVVPGYQQRASGILGQFYGSGNAALDQYTNYLQGARQQIGGAFDQISQGYQEREATLENAGDQARIDIQQQFLNAEALGMQDLTARGLTGSTLAPSMSAMYTTGQANALGGLEEQLRQQRANLSGDTLAAQENMATNLMGYDLPIAAGMLGGQQWLGGTGAGLAAGLTGDTLGAQMGLGLTGLSGMMGIGMGGLGAQQNLGLAGLNSMQNMGQWGIGVDVGMQEMQLADMVSTSGALVNADMGISMAGVNNQNSFSFGYPQNNYSQFFQNAGQMGAMPKPPESRPYYQQVFAPSMLFDT